MENKLNLPPFYVGQKVEYVTGKRMPKGSKHIVTGIYRNDCGCWIVYINGENEELMYSTALFWDNNCCGKLTPNIGPIKGGWVASSFRSIQQTKFPLITLEKIKETEKEEILISN